MKTSRMIRIFVSSTFSDFEEDRNTLFEHVFSKLKKHCENNGFSFQIVDLRWGISATQAERYQTARLCLQEIQRCQQQSPKPNFLVLAGTRYGWIPLPEVIDKTRYGKILSICSEDEKALIHTAYQQDFNDLNQAYYLKSLDNEANVRETLFSKAHVVLENESLIAFGASMTEQEIHKGLFDIEDAKTHTLVCLRNGTSYDAGSTLLRQQLKKTLSSNPDNLITYTICNNDFIATVYQRLITICNQRMQDALLQEKQQSLDMIKKQEKLDNLEENHARFINVSNHLDSLKLAVLQAKGHVLLVKGKAGTGKTSLLKAFAYTTKSIALFTDLDKECVNLNGFVTTLAKDLNFTDEKLPLETNRQYLSRCLQSVKQDTIIIFDSFDDLIDKDETLLTMPLPKNITLVIGIINSSSPAQSYSLESRNKAEAIPMLKEMLKQKHRTLTESQWKIVQEGIPAKTVPLYLFELAETLSQYTSHDEFKFTFRKSTTGMINDSFTEKYKLYNETLTKHAFAYISHTSHGLLETELLDLLWREKSLKNTIHRHNQTYAHKSSDPLLPLSNLWSSLYNNSSSFLITFPENNRYLIKFRHKIIKDIASSSAKKSNSAILATMAEYFEDLSDDNPRKLDEMLSLYHKVDTAKEKKYLTLYPVQNAWINSGRYENLVTEMNGLGCDTSFLVRHRFLFRHHPDSFPHAVNRQENEEIFPVPWLRSNDIIDLHSIGRPLYPKGKIALRNDGLVAIDNIDSIVLYHWERSISTDSFPMEKQQVRSMYWRKNDLIVRKSNKRYILSVHDYKFLHCRQEDCPNHLDLYSNNPQTVLKAGGYEEADYGTFHERPTIPFYINDKRYFISLFYLKHRIKTFTHKEMACIIVSPSLIHIVNMLEKQVYMSLPIRNVCNACFSSDNKHLLAVTKEGDVLNITVTKQMNQGMVFYPNWKKMEKRNNIKHAFEEIQNMVTVLILSEPKDIPSYQPANLTSPDSFAPLFSCLSIRYSYYALYYNPHGFAYVRVYSLDNHKLLLESIVDPIHQEDLSGDPFHCEGMHIHVISKGICHDLDLLSGKWSAYPSEKKDYGIFRENNKLMVLDHDPETPFYLRLISFMRFMFFSIAGNALKFANEQNTMRTEHVIQKKDGNLIFTINISRRTIHIYDEPKQAYILHDELPYPFIAADVSNKTLFILKDYGSAPLSYILQDSRISVDA